MTTRVIAHPLVHFLSLHSLLCRQQSKDLRLHPFMFDDPFGLQLRLLVREVSHFRFVKLSVCRRGFELLLNLFHLLVPSLFSRPIAVHQRFDLGLLVLRQPKHARHVLHHFRTRSAVPTFARTTSALLEMVEL